MPVGYNVGCSFAWKTRLIKVVKVISSVALFRDLTILEFLQILLGLFYSAVLFLGCMLGICPLFFYLLFLSCISFSLKVLSSFFIITFSLFGITNYIRAADERMIPSFRHSNLDRLLADGDFLPNNRIT